MNVVTDLIEDWIQIRATLQRHLKVLESAQMHTEASHLDNTTQFTIIRIKAWIADLNALLKEHSRVE